jgi:peptidoglycan/LPS O-acetylase OafA/YrhL
MSHYFIIRIAEVITKRVINFPTKLINGNIVPQLSIIQTIVFSLVIITIVLLLSSFLYKYIEEPILKKYKNIIG